MQLQRLVAGGQLASFGAAGAGSSYQKAWKKIDRQTDCGGGCKNTVIIRGQLLDEWKLSE